MTFSLEVNDEPLDSREEFIIIISSLKPGDEAKILYQRKGARLSVKANLGVRPSLVERMKFLAALILSLPLLEK